MWSKIGIQCLPHVKLKCAHSINPHNSQLIIPLNWRRDWGKIYLLNDGKKGVCPQEHKAVVLLQSHRFPMKPCHFKGSTPKLKQANWFLFWLFSITLNRNQFAYLNFGVDTLTWQSFIEIGEMACCMTAWCSHGHTLKAFLV